jgi:molecular chaperone DnaK (HSP70)
MSNKVFGIDLGTTYSAIAVVDETGRPIVINNAEGDPTTPSVVFFESPENVVVGKEAKALARLHPDLVCSLVKREMGSEDYTFTAHGRAYRPEEVSSFILRKVVADAEAELGEKITQVVVTVPAYFGNAEREATRAAAELAGLVVKEILSEPIAAAIAYGAKVERTERIFVYDLGGGTFDATVVECGPGGVRVLCTGGNHALGGADWDQALMTVLAQRFMVEAPDAGDPLDDALGTQRLQLAAEDAKRALSTKEKHVVTMDHRGYPARVTITREELEQITGALLEETLTISRDTLAKAAREHGATTLDRVLLVGGMSRMPVIKRAVHDLTGLEPQLHDPDQSVAKGAALSGLIGIAKEELAAGASVAEVGARLGLSSAKVEAFNQIEITSVCTKGIGIIVENRATRQNEVHFLIHADSPLPAACTDQFATVRDNQTQVAITVVEQAGQMESPDPAHAKEITSGFIQDIPPMPAGAEIEVTFALRNDGTLDVQAEVVRTGQALHLVTKVTGVMSDAEIATSRASLAKVAVA